MNTDQTETIASVNRFLKIERINRFLQASNADLTFMYDGTTFNINTIDPFGNVKNEDEDVKAQLHLGDNQLDDLLAFVMDQEEEETQ